MRKNMLLSCLALLGATAVMAQTTTTHTENSLFSNVGGLYIKGGLNLANVTTTSDGGVNSAHTRASFNAGLLGDIPLADLFSLQIGAEFTGKGSRAQYNSSLYTGTYTFRPYYIEVPVDAVLKLPVGPQVALLLGAGGYAAMGVAGNYVTNVTSAAGSSTSTSTIKWTDSGDFTTGSENGSGAGVLRRYDFGLNFLLGFELGPVQLTAGYDMGLTKIASSSSNNNDEGKNRAFSLNLAFRL
ncbi:outer membrane beta-barrel protein [Dinghuibacter silviterrae]|uniref:Outer membrane protein with beta-barrel domain n=1 Tax=Dinghuibacter silviterrae TaxID=1539049 RepID=A0A4R8DQ82_9BACT|nr:outer membrane beta-barrel protein [Dinghuibacter silviterrae]TDW99554.1 outer membrane protein with beta-barrel domain [Dinghuibacter silviterrae]